VAWQQSLIVQLGQQFSLLDWSLAVVTDTTDTIEVLQEKFRVMVLHQATSLCDRSIPQRDRKKVWELAEAWER
jgi:hypothetical protein